MAIHLYARELRKNGTIGEKHLWKKLLSRRQLKNYKFLRQKILGSYIYDFYCYELKLIIEIDGNSHLIKSAEDKIKQEYAIGQGFEVVRFAEQEARFHLEQINIEMIDVINELERKKG